MKTLELKSQETHSGYKTFLVAGTVYNFGEDLTSKGRVRCSLYQFVVISLLTLIMPFNILFKGCHFFVYLLGKSVFESVLVVSSIILVLENIIGFGVRLAIVSLLFVTNVQRS